MQENTLYYGDNLVILREFIKDESIDLIYLDPPFNSEATYNVLFKSPDTKEQSHSQITAFEDTWHWGHEAQMEYDEIINSSNIRLSELIQALRKFLKENDMMAYLVMIANRLIELHRVLKPSGSLYLHCDPTASHYLKLVLDAVFGFENYQNEITWKRTTAHNDTKKFGKNTDIIFFYTKTDKFTFNIIYQPYDEEYKARFRNIDKDGRRWADYDLSAKGLSGGGYIYEYKGYKSLWRCPIETMKKYDEEGRLHFTKTGGIRFKRYLDDMPGMPCQSLWDDISPINSQAKERLGYPTQKPLSLLERIIQASSNPGDIVLDPFCGCGTASHAAQKLNRRWIGIDITCLAISLIEKRMKEAFPGLKIDIKGTPKDIESAMDLARRDKYQFQWWAISLIDAVPYQDKKKGADSGIDGIIFFDDEGSGKYKKIIISVKGGEHINVSMIRDLKGTIERENAAIGIFITLFEPTEPMKKEAASAPLYISQRYPSLKCPSIQILTIKGLLDGTEKPIYPNVLLHNIGFKKSEKENTAAPQNDLFSS